jgi:hypothetical protein
MSGSIFTRALAALLLATFSVPARATDTLLTLAPRPGATWRIVVDRPAAPIGSVILFAGGSGLLDVDDRGAIGSGAANHLVRTRQSYVKSGYATFVPDIPNDLKDQSGYRSSGSYAVDLALLVQEARKIARPVAVIGTSRGALSVAAVLVKQAAVQPDAAVISSGALMGDRGGSAAAMGDWRQVRIPVLLLRHAQDACRVTPPGDADRFKSLLSGSPRVDIITMNGGGPASSDADKCGASHYHGFYGIDDKVVQTTVSWLKANMR